MNILIVGAGPAGLALANFLDSKKHTVTIIERSPTFSTVGFGIFFFPEGRKLLQKATHQKTIHRFLRQIGYRKYIDEHGQLLGESHYKALFHINRESAITSIKRTDLHRLLEQSLPKTVTVKMGTTIACIENHPENAHVTLSDGSSDTYDLVVGADGTHSMLREQFFSYRIKTMPWTTRYFWINTPVPRFTLEWGRTATIMCMPHKDRTTVMAIEPVDAPNTPENFSSDLLHFYTSVGLTPQEVAECYRQSHVSTMRYVFTKTWYVQRVVLIGDAQHAMTPTLGLGTSSALEDAYELAVALNSVEAGTQVPSALRRFSRKRTRKLTVLRGLNRFTDCVIFHRSKLYMRFWYRERKIIVWMSQVVDWLLRLGWRLG